MLHQNAGFGRTPALKPNREYFQVVISKSSQEGGQEGQKKKQTVSMFVSLIGSTFLHTWCLNAACTVQK